MAVGPACVPTAGERYRRLSAVVRGGGPVEAAGILARAAGGRGTGRRQCVTGVGGVLWMRSGRPEARDQTDRVRHWTAERARVASDLIR